MQQVHAYVMTENVASVMMNKQIGFGGWQRCPLIKSSKNNEVHYAEGIYVGYRHFDKAGIKPLFPFGYGLSYTTFGYDHLKLSNTELKPDGNITASVDITNTAIQRKKPPCSFDHSARIGIASHSGARPRVWSRVIIARIADRNRKSNICGRYCIIGAISIVIASSTAV